MDGPRPASEYQKASHYRLIQVAKRAILHDCVGAIVFSFIFGAYLTKLIHDDYDNDDDDDDGGGVLEVS